MTSEVKLGQLSLEAAHSIEDLFAQHHAGGRTQRLAKVQVIVREAMRASGSAPVVISPEYRDAYSNAQQLVTTAKRTRFAPVASLAFLGGMSAGMGIVGLITIGEPILLVSIAFGVLALSIANLNMGIRMTEAILPHSSRKPSK